MKKKAEFNFQTYLIGIVLIMGIIVTFSAFYMDAATEYNQDTTEASSFSATYDKISTLSSHVNTLKNTSETANLGTESSSTTFYGSMVNIVQVIQSIYDIPTSIITNMAETFSIDRMWIIIAIMIVVIMVVTTALFMIFQGKGS